MANYALIFNGTGRVDIPQKVSSGGARRLLLVDFLNRPESLNRCLVGNDLAGNNSSISINNSTTIEVRVFNQATRTITISPALPTGEFTLEVFKNASNTFTVNVDGVQVGSTNVSGGEISALDRYQYIGQCGNKLRLDATTKRMIVLDDEYLNTASGNQSTWGDGTLNGIPSTNWQEYGAGSTPISFAGNIANQTFTAGDVVDVDLATGNYSGTETPFSFALTSGSLAGTSLTLSSAGVLSGTATEASVTGLVITGTDAESDTAASNSFSVTVNAVPPGNSATAEFTMPQFAVAVSAETSAPTTDAVLTSEPLKDNTGTLLANQALDYVAIYDSTTGELVLRVTGLSTNASGVFSVENAALSAGVAYKIDWKVTTQSVGRMPTKAAV